MINEKATMLPLEVAGTYLKRLRGLLGREPCSGVLMIVPCKAIHTFGMRHAIDVAFFDDTGMVVRSERGVAPRRRMSCAQAQGVLERFSYQGSGWFEAGDRLLISEEVHERK